LGDRFSSKLTEVRHGKENKEKEMLRKVQKKERETLLKLPKSLAVEGCSSLLITTDCVVRRFFGP
jgi:hypothetical protein